LKTDRLISALAGDATVRWPLGTAFAISILVGVAAVAVIFFGLLGFRPDISTALTTPRFLLKLVLTLALAITTLGLLNRSARPAVPAGLWRWAWVVVPALLLAALLMEMSAVPPSSWMVRLVGRNWLHCLASIPAMAAAPLAGLLLALRQGAPEKPGLAGALAGLAASGIAALFYATNCTDDSPLFVAVWYPLATALVTLVGYFVGRKLLRW
jgi:hypothetical protein